MSALLETYQTKEKEKENKNEENFFFRQKQKYKIAENLNERANDFRRNPVTHNP